MRALTSTATVIVTTSAPGIVSEGDRDGGLTWGRTASPDTQERPAPPRGPPSQSPRQRSPTSAHPASVRPASARPTSARPSGARPTSARPSGARPASAHPTSARPASVRPASARPGGARSGGARPGGCPQWSALSASVDASVIIARRLPVEKNPGDEAVGAAVYGTGVAADIGMCALWQVTGLPPVFAYALSTAVAVIRPGRRARTGPPSSSAQHRCRQRHGLPTVSCSAQRRRSKPPARAAP